MLRLSLLRPIFFVLLFFSFSFGDRPFDWQYNRLNIPFAVFYNPSLLGNNPGFTIGFDGKHIDSENYDVRGAVVIPISRVMEREEHLRNRGINKHFRYANNSYRSSGSAISIGGLYDSYENYGLSAGFVMPVNLVHSGMSVDFMYRDSNPFVALNAGISADVPRVVRGSTLHLSFRNIVVNERDSTNKFNFLVGASGIPFSDMRMYFLPYDFFFNFYVEDGGVSKVEGTARVNLDLTSSIMSRGENGQTAAGSLGYSFVRKSNGLIDHKFFASLGIVFVNRSSSAALLGSYNQDNEKFGAVTFSSFQKESGNVFAALELRETNDGQTLFSLKSGGAARSWVLRIDNVRGGNIRTFSGGSIVPSSILWDGLNSQGQFVDEEIIYVKLVVRGANKVVESNTIAIEQF